jgi:hypothetical protein
MIFNLLNLASDFYSAILAVPAGGNVTVVKQKPANSLGVELNGYNQSSAVAQFGWGVANNEMQILEGNFGDIVFHNAGGSNVNVQILRAFLM